jgi:hypothetical protein
MTGLRRWVEDQPLPTRLHWTAQYFRWCGVSSAFFLGVFLAMTPFSSAIRADVTAHPAGYLFTFLASAMTAASWWWTGERLRGRHRDGAWMAIISLAIPLFGLARGSAGPGLGTLVVSVLGLVAILTSWKELD